MWIPSAKVAIGIGAVTAAVYYAGKWGMEKHAEMIAAETPAQASAPGPLRVSTAVLNMVRDRLGVTKA